MIATLEFDLNDEGERIRHQLCLDAPNILSAIQDHFEWLRSQIKYAPETVPPEIVETFERCRTELFEALETRNIDLDRYH